MGRFFSDALRPPPGRAHLEQSLRSRRQRPFRPGRAELEDSLVNRMGFEEAEAATAIEQPPQQALFDDLPLFAQSAPLTLTVDRLPDLAGLSSEEQSGIIIHELAPGNVQVQVYGYITAALAERLGGVVRSRCGRCCASRWPSTR